MSLPIDFLAYPPTSFPFRDLLVLEHLPLGSSDDVCEIGVGSGATTARLARLCASVTGFEISASTVDALRYLEGRHPNLKLVVADVTRPEQVAEHAGKFTRLVSCDTLEHVNDAGAYFDAIGKLLAPGGRFLVTFPNEPVEKMHGVTRFDAADNIEALMKRAGLVGKIGAAQLTPGANRVAETLGWKPLRTVRKLLKRRTYGRQANEATGKSAPQTFDETDFAKKMGTWKRISPAVNLYWYGVLRLMAQQGQTFELDWSFSSAPFTECQVCISGHKLGANGGPPS